MQNLRKLASVLSLFTFEQPELTGSEIAALLNRPKSTVYRTLNAIAAAGFLDHDRATGHYRLGIRLASLGEIARQSTSLQRLAHAALTRVTGQTGELSTVMVQTGPQGINIEVVESRQVLMLPGLVGTPQPLHASAGGKAILAWQDEEAVIQTFPWPLERFTRSTITDRKRFLAELGLVRRNGYGTSWGEHSADIVGAGAPVRDHRGTVVAAMTVGCPKTRASIATMTLMIRTVVAEADRLSRALGFTGEAHVLPAKLPNLERAGALALARR
jgi:DNA-binding IclR family transcriptional regulator